MTWCLKGLGFEAQIPLNDLVLFVGVDERNCDNQTHLPLKSQYRRQEVRKEQLSGTDSSEAPELGQGTRSLSSKDPALPGASDFPKDAESAA